MKVVYNAKHSGFGLSNEAINYLKSKFKLKVSEIKDLSRHDSRLVEVVEQLGCDASSRWALLKIHNLKQNKYYIDEYDGYETVVEPSDVEWIDVG